MFKSEQKLLIKTLPCSKRYKFGHGEEVQATKRMIIPIRLGHKNASLSVDIVPVNIPLLLSKESLSKGNSKIDFEKNCLSILGEDLPLNETESGHLIISLGLHDADQ